MKTLQESLFGDNITNGVNVTTISAAEQVVIAGLENALKMKYVDVNSIQQSSFLNKKLWAARNWTLAMYSDSKNKESDTTNIYLQYNLDWPPLVYLKPGKEVETMTLTIRFIIRIGVYDNAPRLGSVECEVIEGFDYQVGTSMLDVAIEKNTRLKNIMFESNTQGIVKFLEECFTKFKWCVDKGAFDEVFRQVYVKNISGGQVRRRSEHLAVEELSRLFNIIVK
jgi:hypothetical protein